MPSQHQRLLSVLFYFVPHNQAVSASELTFGSSRRILFRNQMYLQCLFGHTLRVSESTSIWFVLCLNISASEWTFGSCRLMPFCDQMYFSSVQRIFPKSETTMLFFGRTVRVSKNNSIWFVNMCQHVNSIKFVRKDLVSIRCQKARQDNNTTCVIFIVLFSTQILEN